MLVELVALARGLQRCADTPLKTLGPVKVVDQAGPNLARCQRNTTVLADPTCVNRKRRPRYEGKGNYNIQTAVAFAQLVSPKQWQAERSLLTYSLAKSGMRSLHSLNK